MVLHVLPWPRSNFCFVLRKYYNVQTKSAYVLTGHDVKIILQCNHN